MLQLAALAATAHKTSDGAYSIFAVLFVIGIAVVCASFWAPIKSGKKRVNTFLAGLAVIVLSGMVIYIDQLL